MVVINMSAGGRLKYNKELEAQSDSSHSFLYITNKTMKKIILTGATGLVGKKLGIELVKRGFSVTALVRDKKKAKRELPFPAELIEWNALIDDKIKINLEGTYAIIHLAGASVAEKRWTKKIKEEIYKSRVISTQNISRAIEDQNPKSLKLFLSASAIGFYADSKSVQNESSPKGAGFLSDVCEAWEQPVCNISAAKTSIFRIGMVLSSQGGALAKLLPVFERGLGGPIGSGSHFMSWISLEDLVGSLCYFVENPEKAPKLWNAVSPNVVTNLEFSKTLARTLKRPCIFPVPTFILKAIFGEMSAVILSSQNISSQKLIEAGYNFKFSKLEDTFKFYKLDALEHEFYSELFVEKKRAEIFPFFAKAENLEKITPEFLNFKIISKSTSDIQKGTEIIYKLKLHGIPIKWKTIITEWQPEIKFTDFQEKGPYSLWNHEHEFYDLASGTLMIDRVRYKIPFGFLGNFFAHAFVRSEVDKIFNYRRKVIENEWK